MSVKMKDLYENMLNCLNNYAKSKIEFENELSLMDIDKKELYSHFYYINDGLQHVQKHTAEVYKLIRNIEAQK